MSESPQSVRGLVVALWRYPVKSMMGEELNAADVTSGGILGDRAYALVDSSDGKVASAKNPAQVAHPVRVPGRYTNADTPLLSVPKYAAITRRMVESYSRRISEQLV